MLAATPPPTAYDRYRPYRRWIEWGAWIGLIGLGAASETMVVGMELRRAGLPHHPMEPAIWEWSSHLVLLALVPGIAWYTRRFPLHLDTWVRVLPAWLLGSLVFCVLHVAGMVALREAVYAWAGADYDFGNWDRQLLYEYLKDGRTFLQFALVMEGYRFLLRRLQGEARLDPARFQRVHRSHIVNLDSVASIEPLDTGDARIHLHDGSTLPCSRRYRAALKDRLGAAS